MKNYIKKVFQTFIFGLCILVIALVVYLSYIAYSENVVPKKHHPYISKQEMYEKYSGGKYSKYLKYSKYGKYLKK